MSSVTLPLTGWVEDNIDETLTFYRLPRQHHKHLKSHQYAGAPQRGAQEPHPGCAHLPQWRELPAAGAGTGGRDPRELARAASLSEYGRSARAQEGGTAPCGLTPDRFSLAPCSLGQEPALAKAGDAARRLRRCCRRRGGILDCRCARRSAGRQVGTQGWSYSNRTKGCPLDLSFNRARSPCPIC